MKNHLGAVVGVSMLVVAGVVVSQLLPGNSEVSVGNIVSETCPEDTLWDAVLKLCRSLASPPTSPPPIICTDKRMHGEDLDDKVICGKTEFEAKANYVNAANAYCKTKKFEGAPELCAPPKGCVQATLGGVIGEGIEENITCAETFRQCPNQFGCQSTVKVHCDLLRTCVKFDPFFHDPKLLQ